jgi:hypothetical protein
VTAAKKTGKPCGVVLVNRHVPPCPKGAAGERRRDGTGDGYHVCGAIVEEGRWHWSHVCACGHSWQKRDR